MAQNNGDWNEPLPLYPEYLRRNYETDWMVHLGPVFGQALLGSQDGRRGAYYAVSYGKPEPRFFYNVNPAQLVFEGYMMVTNGIATERFFTEERFHYGVLAIARYWTEFPANLNGFVEFGFGLMYVNRETIDLSAKFNTTPMIGAGVSIPIGDQEYIIMARLFHASNGGTTPPNLGLNQIQFSVGMRF